MNGGISKEFLTALAHAEGEGEAAWNAYKSKKRFSEEMRG